MSFASNPSGRVFTRAELDLIARLCVEHDVAAITDEIDEHIIYHGRDHIPLATLPGMAERTITTSGLSRTYTAIPHETAKPLPRQGLHNGKR